MVRLLCAWFLLLNYLLVVGAGLRVGRPEAPAFLATRPYVHSEECQQQHYLRLDCFEQCNGDQRELKVKLPTETPLHFLAQLRGVDVHCAFEAWPMPVCQQEYQLTQQRLPAQPTAVLQSGFGSRDYPPPRQS